MVALSVVAIVLYLAPSQKSRASIDVFNVYVGTSVICRVSASNEVFFVQPPDKVVIQLLEQIVNLQEKLACQSNAPPRLEN